MHAGYNILVTHISVSSSWRLQTPEHEKGVPRSSGKLFAVGAEVHGGDRSFVAFKITFQNRVLLGWKVVMFESRCKIRTRGVRGQRRLSGPGGRRGHRGKGEGSAGIPLQRAPHPRLGGGGEESAAEGPAPARPPRPAAGAARGLGCPLNPPGDSDAGEPRKLARESAVPEPAPAQPRVPRSPEQRPPSRLGKALPVPGSERTAGLPDPGCPYLRGRSCSPTRPRHPKVGSGSGPPPGPYRGGHAGSG